MKMKSSHRLQFSKMSKVMKKDQSSRRQPYFVKGMIGDFRNKLRIPMTFIKDFKGNVPKQFKLRNLIGRSWIVSVKQVDDDFFLCNEWKAFAKDNALEFGEYIMCVQNADSDFTVKICSKNSCNKKASLAKKNIVESSSCMKEGKEHKETAKTGILPPHIMRKCQIRNDKESVSSTSCKPDTQIVKTERKNTVSGCDFFTATLVVSNNYRMGIPRWLAVEFFMEKDSITLLNTCGNSWTVKVSHEKDGRTCLSAGWREFYKANGLDTNDTCRFEIVNDMDNAIRVEILEKGAKEPLGKQASTAMTQSTYTSKEVNGASRTKKKKKNVTNKSLSYIEHVRSGHAAGQLKDAESPETISTRASTSGFPSFSVPLLPSYVYGSSYLNVPVPFAKTYLKDADDVILRTPDGRCWHVKYREPCKMGKGWKGFVSDNHLKEGDVCKFELVDSNHMELLVTVFPAEA